jgi:hypothetical protein
MSGLFCACCPECGVELHVDESGYGTCTNCGHVYLNRLGYLIPVEVSVDADTDSDVVDIDVDTVGVASTDVRSVAQGDGSNRSAADDSLSTNGALL